MVIRFVEIRFLQCIYMMVVPAREEAVINHFSCQAHIIILTDVSIRIMLEIFHRYFQ